MRNKATASVKSGHKTGGKASATKKRKCASALANQAGLKAVKALQAKRRANAETEEDVDELEGAEQEEEEGEEEEGEEGEESGDIEEQESQEAETHIEPQKKRGKDQRYSLFYCPCIPAYVLM